MWQAGFISIAEALERDRRLVGELDREPEAATHGLDVAAQGREHEVAALFELGDRGLTDAQGFCELRLGQVPCFAEILEGLIFGMEPVGLGFDPRPSLGWSPAILSFSVVPIVSSSPRREMAVEAVVRPRDQPSVEALLAAAGLVSDRQQNGSPVAIERESDAPDAAAGMAAQLLHVRVPRLLQRVGIRLAELRPRRACTR
jgi:hypothetical protein